MHAVGSALPGTDGDVDTMMRCSPPAAVAKCTERTTSGCGAQNGAIVLPSRTGVASTITSWFGGVPGSGSGSGSGSGASVSTGRASLVSSRLGAQSAVNARKRLVLQPYVLAAGGRPWFV
jgi:hypothetical protein